MQKRPREEENFVETLTKKNVSPKEIADKLYDLNPSLTHIAHEIIEWNLNIDALYEAISSIARKAIYDPVAEGNIAKCRYHIHEIREKYNKSETSKEKQKEFKNITGLLLWWRAYFVETSDDESADKLLIDYSALLAYKGIDYRWPTIKKELEKVLKENEEDEK